MGVRHRKDADYWRENINTLLEICEAFDDENTDKLRRLRGRAKNSDSSENRSNKFENDMNEIAQDIDGVPWKRFIKKVNDDIYEENRVRISVSKRTERQLEKARKQLELESFEEVIKSLLKKKIR